MSNLLRVYLDPDEIGLDGYPYAWHLLPDQDERVGIKDIIREHAGHRCERCGHPYRKGEHGRGEWTPCDRHCTHGGPVRFREAGWPDDSPWGVEHEHIPMTASEARLDYQRGSEIVRWDIQARWRILTVHHLNGIKYDCRWWNLAALCQRDHLTIQGRVVMNRVYALEHSEWFKPHAAGWYAASYLGEDLTREETMARLDELLALERAA